MTHCASVAGRYRELRAVPRRGDPEYGQDEVEDFEDRIAGGADTVMTTRQEVITSLHEPEMFILALVDVNDEIADEPRDVRGALDARESPFDQDAIQFNLKRLLERAGVPDRYRAGGKAALGGYVGPSGPGEQGYERFTREKHHRARGDELRADRGGPDRSPSSDRVRRAEQHRQVVSGDPDLCAAPVFWW